MAIRIDFFTITGTLDFELVPVGTLDAAVSAFDADAPPPEDSPVRCVGWLFASDEDEAAFTGWCDAIDDDLGIGLLHQGLGEDHGLDQAAVTAGSAEPEVSWSAVVREAVAAAGGGRLGWRSEFS